MLVLLRQSVFMMPWELTMRQWPLALPRRGELLLGAPVLSLYFSVATIILND
jgi:hypothetical protein